MVIKNFSYLSFKDFLINYEVSFIFVILYLYVNVCIK